MDGNPGPSSPPAGTALQHVGFSVPVVPTPFLHAAHPSTLVTDGTDVLSTLAGSSNSRSASQVVVSSDEKGKHKSVLCETIPTCLILTQVLTSSLTAERC